MTLESSMKGDVLLAEDEPVSQRFLCDALQALGYRCEAVGDGRRALERATAQRFDLLLLDVNLPELSGPEALAGLRRTPVAASQRTPAVALTADDEPRVRQRLLDAGFAAVGTKPISVVELATLLDSVLLGVDPEAAQYENVALWDDRAALRATGGNRDIVTALRDLMRKELPGQRAAIVAAVDRGDVTAARDELHRLRAACGFCGAIALSLAVDRLHAALAVSKPDRNSLTLFLTEIEQLLAEGSL